jgi:hypothetical protein
MQQRGLWMMLRMVMDLIGKLGNIKVVVFVQYFYFSSYNVFGPMVSLYFTFLIVLYTLM